MLGEATESQKRPLELPVNGNKRLSWVEFALHLAIWIPSSVMQNSAGTDCRGFTSAVGSHPVSVYSEFANRFTVTACADRSGGMSANI